MPEQLVHLRRGEFCVAKFRVGHAHGPDRLHERRKPVGPRDAQALLSRPRMQRQRAEHQVHTQRVVHRPGVALPVGQDGGLTIHFVGRREHDKLIDERIQRGGIARTQQHPRGGDRVQHRVSRGAPGGTVRRRVNRHIQGARREEARQRGVAVGGGGEVGHGKAQRVGIGCSVIEKCSGGCRSFA
ncbi:hypothetical protein OT109_13225 [Phycisphaeraceae bacterium D3-23]